MLVLCSRFETWMSRMSEWMNEWMSLCGWALCCVVLCARRWAACVFVSNKQNMRRCGRGSRRRMRMRYMRNKRFQHRGEPGSSRPNSRMAKLVRCSRSTIDGWGCNVEVLLGIFFYSHFTYSHLSRSVRNVLSHHAFAWPHAHSIKRQCEMWLEGDLKLRLILLAAGSGGGSIYSFIGKEFYFLYNFHGAPTEDKRKCNFRIFRLSLNGYGSCRWDLRCVNNLFTPKW